MGTEMLMRRLVRGTSYNTQRRKHTGTISPSALCAQGETRTASSPREASHGSGKHILELSRKGKSLARRIERIQTHPRAARVAALTRASRWRLAIAVRSRRSALHQRWQRQGFRTTDTQISTHSSHTARPGGSSVAEPAAQARQTTQIIIIEHRKQNIVTPTMETRESFVNHVV